MPITSAQPASELGLQMNGVKRKRTGERATPGHHHHHAQGDGTTTDGSCHSHNNNHLLHSSHHKIQHGSRAPIAAEDQVGIDLIL